MIRVLGTWQRRVAALGRKEASLLLLKRVLERASARSIRLIRYHIVAQPVPTRRWLSPRRGRDIEVRPVGRNEPALAEFPRPAAVFSARFDQGAECLCAFHESRPVGFIWFTLGDYEEDEVRCLFSPQPRDLTAWDFDVYVDPAYRLGPTFLRLWDETNERLRAAGVCWSLSRIDAFNTSSLQAHKRLGAVKLASLAFVTVAGLQCMTGSRRGWSGVSRDPARRPVVKVDVGELERRGADAGSATPPSREPNSLADVPGGKRWP